VSDTRSPETKTKKLPKNIGKTGLKGSPRRLHPCRVKETGERAKGGSGKKSRLWNKVRENTELYLLGPKQTRRTQEK